MHATLKAISEKAHVNAEDVLRLRREVFGDHAVDREEVAVLFRLAEQAPSGEREWAQFLAEVTTDFFVRQKTPAGYITDEDADFLLACFGPADRTSALKIDTLCHMLQAAKHVPERLIAFGLETVKAHVLADRRVDAREVERLRAFVFAAGGDGNVAVTRQEAELLFDLNDLSRAGDNDPTWIAFFALAISNHLMAHIGYAPMSREDALQMERNIADHSVNVSRFMGRIAGGGLSGFGNAFKKDRTREKHNDARAAEAAVAEQVTSPEASWLADRIGLYGDYCSAEQALIVRLKELRGELPPELDALAARA
ncbi:hypothetical protein [Parvularcula sp. IMCC14364]|uniref:hypothetical protein n=1 Tax=Parvularcula sp. IMCC14364 TaxID=3067902 RepID=UPI0027409EB5|nr:hypothetical protein [Parvularcula sp. IMCC14364]